MTYQRASTTAHRKAPKGFGAALRRVRLAKAWSIDTAAEHLGLDAKTLQRLETGVIEMKLAVAAGIAKALGCSVDELFLAGGEGGYLSRQQATAVTPRKTDEPTLGPNASARAVLSMVGAQVAAARFSAGWTQRTLAARVGLSVGSVSQIEQGQQNLTVTTMAQLAQALGVSTATLVTALVSTGAAAKKGKPRIRTARPR